VHYAKVKTNDLKGKKNYLLDAKKMVSKIPTEGASN